MEITSVCIVGHGPSLLQQRAGELIDAHDFVVRQKRCQETLKFPEQYGTRTDAVCGSWGVAKKLEPLAPEVWVFIDSRYQGIPDEVIEQTPWKIDKRLCNEWNAKYRSRRTPYVPPEQTVEYDRLGHPHVSSGFHTLLYACEFLRPEYVTLAGFDNVETGDFTWSITRGPEYDQYPDHRWDIEHEMLKDVEDEWDVEIRFI